MLKEGQETQPVSIDQLAGRSFGHYQLEKLLGRGELSTVYMAHQTTQNRKVMITMFKFPAGISPQERAQLNVRFAREAAILVQFDHPNIIPMYDYGELMGHPYLVTAFVKGASLRQVMRQQGRFTPQQILVLLKQMASALDYAHSHGVVHDSLSLSNIVKNQDANLQIIGFGLKTIIEAHRGTTTSPAHNMSIDNRSDIYALGMILYEMISGTMPFSENTSTNSSQYLQPRVPSIRTVSPEVPEALDLVIGKALEPDPAKRYAQAGNLAVSFERVLSLLGIVPNKSSSPDRRSVPDEQMTLPPTVNWFDETGKWRAQGPAATGRNEPKKFTSPLVTVMKPDAFMGNNSPDSIAGVDPFSLWSATGAKQAVSAPLAPLVPASTAPTGTFPSSTRPQARRSSRRKVVSLLAAGAVGAGVLAVGGVSLAHVLQNKQPAPLAKKPATTVNKKTAATTQTKEGAQKAAALTKAPVQQPMQKPAQQPKQQPTPPPAHMGTTIGYTMQAPNSAKIVTNPADGRSTLLIHLPNGKFVAAERACTHQGILVDYDPASHMIVCPAHGAIFDPANGFSHVSGPGMGPLANVVVHVNADGTITA